jgi:HJR/Mrr/RecB family endonuclease
MAREIAWRRLQDAKLAEQIAKQNLSNFESNPMAYLTNQTVPISLTNSTP